MTDCCTNSIDYIVVGSGPGGCAAAQVLVSNPNNNVLMLEAGVDHDNDPAINDSTQAGRLEREFFNQYFWIIIQILQTHAVLNGVNYSNGRLWGGGSAINGEQDVRGTRAVFDKWFRITGDPDWNSDNIFDTFVEYEKFIPVIRGPSQGYTGPVSIRQAPVIPTASATKFVQAVTSAFPSLPETIDYNNPDTAYGPYTRWQLFQKANGNRESSSTAILKPILLKHKNFRIASAATVTKVLWEGNRAVGVKYIQNGVCKKVYANKTVVLSSGIITPIILQHSGVGDAELLQSLGIRVKSNLPNVGRNLANHILLTTVFSKNPADVRSSDPNALYDSGAFLPDPVSMDQSKPRGSQWIGVNAGSTLVVPILNLRPFSKGFVLLQSKDVLTTAVTSEEALADFRDVEFFMNVVRNQLIPIAQKLQQIDPTYVLLQPDPTRVNDDAYLIDYIRNHVSHAHHWQSQCAMAPRDKGGVCDSNGRPYGTKNLYIADDCIVPFDEDPTETGTVDGNTAAIAFTIGYIIGRKILKKQKLDNFVEKHKINKPTNAIGM